MPKTKKLESDSESDSGPEDRHPAKKSKSDGGKSSGSARKNDEGDSYWDLGSKKRITVRAFKGTTFVDIREYYEKDGKMLPGKKGIALKAGDWGLVKSLADEIDAAVDSK